jgi:hypothetical protein
LPASEYPIWISIKIRALTLDFAELGDYSVGLHFAGGLAVDGLILSIGEEAAVHKDAVDVFG